MTHASGDSADARAAALSTRLDRRRFLGACGGALACAAVSGCASVVAHQVTPSDGRVALRLADHPELSAAGGSLTIQPRGREDPLLVLRLDDREFAVLSPICTHRGCTVEVAGDRLECPCHGSTYDRKGTVLGGPAERALARYAAHVDGERLVIDLGAVR